MSGRAAELQPNGIFGQALRAITASDLAAQNGPNHAVDIADGQFSADRQGVFQGGFTYFQQEAVVESFFQAVILPGLVHGFVLVFHIRAVKDFGEIQPAGLPVLDGLAHLQPV